MLRALILELHGLLVDDRQQRARILGELAAASSLPLDDGEAAAVARLDDVRAIQRLFARAGRGLSEDGLRRLLAEMDERANQEAPPLRQGARELVESAAASLPVGVIAGSMRGGATRLLKDAGLFSRLVALLGAEEAAIPSPLALSLCLGRMSEVLARWRIDPIAPRQALLVTDSQEGILAAREVGMRVVAVAHEETAAALADADQVVGSLEEIDLGAIAGALF